MEVQLAADLNRRKTAAGQTARRGFVLLLRSEARPHTEL
jgi:hypothetical protein